MLSVQRNLELGREKLDLGDYAGALVHADAALAQDASSFEALQMRSRALYHLGRDTEALQTLRLVHAVRQQHVPRHADIDTGDEAEESLDDIDDTELIDYMMVNTDALETLLALRERYNFDAELLLLLAELAEDAGRYEIAREAYEDLVEIEPNRLEAWEGLVHVLSHEDLDAALQVIERGLELYPTHSLFFEFLGFIHYRRRQFRQAIIAYRQAVEHGADHLENYESLVLGYLALDEDEAALELTRILVHREPNNVEAHRFAVEVALQCEHFDMALYHAHQLIRLQPSHAETYCYKAWVELAQDEWEAAERTLRLGFYKAVDGAYALFALIDFLIGNGALDEALRVADLACELAPDHPESSAARGKVWREKGDYSEALAAFQQAATLAPQDDAYQTWVGVVLDNMGEYQAALAQYNHVLSRHPSDVWTLCNRGLTFLALELMEQALTDFTRGIEIDPQDAPLHFWRAAAFAHMGDYDRAFHDLRRSVDLSDDMLSWLEQEPSLAMLRDDPRYRALLGKSEREG
ncbi:MAG: tetratricopeptide repeat protein [Armatimonadota bacterium]